uniref:Vacuolar protein sorting-associated protein 16 homolog n=1 Tax=Rhabditophanes sp. KR3021 TaxID=114890 RepID=A0AC35TMB4_9BILA
MIDHKANWKLVGNRHYQNEPIYKDVKIHFGNSSFFSISPYGGPYAVANISTKGSLTHYTIEIRNVDGNIYSSIIVEDLLGIEWTKDQKLIIVHRNGNVSLFNTRGKQIGSSIYLNNSSRLIGVKNYKVFYGPVNTGLVVMTRSNEFYAVNNILEASTWCITNFIEQHQSLDFWTVSCHQSETTTIIGFSSTAECFILGNQESNIVKKAPNWMIKSGTYTAGEPNWNNTHIALLHSSKKIQIVRNDLSELTNAITLSELPCDNSIYWCSIGAVALLEMSSVIKIYSLESSDPFDIGNCTLMYQSPIKCVNEIDGLRVYHQTGVNLVSPICHQLENIFSTKATKSSALLYEASKKTRSNYNEAYEYIERILPDMESAVDDCIVAALHSFNTHVQKELMNAARFGKVWERKIDSSKWVEAVKILRMLNSIRINFIGFGISYLQYQDLLIHGVVDRLISFKHWPMAVEVCKHMNLNVEEGVHKVFALWALDYVDRKNDESNEITPQRMADMIFNKMAKYPNISYAEVAKEMNERGYTDLAHILVEKESNVQLKVKMLLHFKQFENALHTAMQSQRLDVLYNALVEVRSQRGSEVLTLITKNSYIQSIYKEFIRDESPDTIFEIYKMNDDHLLQALYHLLILANSKSPFNVDKEKACKDAIKCFQSIKEANAVSLLEDYSYNLNLMDKLNVQELNSNSTCSDLYKHAVTSKNNSLISELSKKYKLTEKQQYAWKLEAYAQNKQWEHMKTLATTKSPIGYLPFVEACVKYDEDKNNIQFYLSKLANTKELVRGYIIAGKVDDAIALAEARKDVDLLRKMSSKFFGNNNYSAKIRNAILTVNSR